MTIHLHPPLALHEIGQRENNEDYIFPAQESKVSSRDNPLFLVCDGVGGMEKGEVASKIVCEGIADYLKGKKIGFSVAGVEEAVLTAMLKPVGLSTDDIELINVNFSLSPSLMSKQVDAVIGAFRNFELNQMDINGVPGKCFYIEEHGMPAYDELIYVAKSDAIDRDKISRFLEATELATQFIINNPQESWKIFSATSKELQDELNKRAWVDTLPRFALRPAAVDVGRYQRMEKFLLEFGLTKSITPVGELVIDVTAGE